MTPIDSWFAAQPEPARSCLLYVRELILSSQLGFTEAWKYKIPFYCINDRMCCYLYRAVKSDRPYIGFVDGNKFQHDMLVQDKRARMKIFYLDTAADIPVPAITALITMAAHYTRRK